MTDLSANRICITCEIYRNGNERSFRGEYHGILLAIQPVKGYQVLLTNQARVAQLDRAPDYGSGG